MLTIFYTNAEWRTIRSQTTNKGFWDFRYIELSQVSGTKSGQKTTNWRII